MSTRPSTPALLNAIDRCSTGNDARDLVRNASSAERRAVAVHLQIAPNDLLDAVTARLRARAAA